MSEKEPAGEREGRAVAGCGGLNGWRLDRVHLFNDSDVGGLGAESPELVDDEVNRHRDDNRDCLCPVGLGAQAGGVIEDVLGQADG